MISIHFCFFLWFEPSLTRDYKISGIRFWSDSSATSFVTRMTTERAKNSDPKIIKSSEGVNIHNQEDMEQELINYFQDLLTEEIYDKNQAINQVTTHIPTILTAEHNASLMKEISMTELEVAVNQMAEGKALGPDGFPICFYREYWETIKYV